jgi:hypothetical protein
MTCPDCHGRGTHDGETPGFMLGLRCHTCQGQGTVDPRMPHWRDLGAQLRAMRQARRLPPRQLAAALGITGLRLADAEHGRIDPEALIYQFEQLIAMTEKWKADAARVR